MNMAAIAAAAAAAAGDEPSLPPSLEGPPQAQAQQSAQAQSAQQSSQQGVSTTGTVEQPAPDSPPAGGSGSPVATLFVSGLPADMKQRELHTLFRPYKGYEGSTMKYMGDFSAVGTCSLVSLVLAHL